MRDLKIGHGDADINDASLEILRGGMRGRSVDTATRAEMHFHRAASPG
jgi:hypothetical protein